MIHLTRLFVFTFIEEFATVLVHRGVYFYTREALGFGETENLLLALCMGAVYVIGALPSYRAADWFGNRRAVLCLLAGQIVMLAFVYHWPQGWLLAVGDQSLCDQSLFQEQVGGQIISRFMQHTIIVQ